MPGKMYFQQQKAIFCFRKVAWMTHLEGVFWVDLVVMLISSFAEIGQVPSPVNIPGEGFLPIGEP